MAYQLAPRDTRIEIDRILLANPMGENFGPGFSQGDDLDVEVRWQMSLKPRAVQPVLRFNSQWIRVKSGRQFCPVSAIDYLMAFGASVSLAQRAREGGTWLVRISLAQTGGWLVGRGQVPDANIKDVPKEFTPEELER